MVHESPFLPSLWMVWWISLWGTQNVGFRRLGHMVGIPPVTPEKLTK